MTKVTEQQQSRQTDRQTAEGIFPKRSAGKLHTELLNRLQGMFAALWQQQQKSSVDLCVLNRNTEISPRNLYYMCG